MMKALSHQLPLLMTVSTRLTVAAEPLPKKWIEATAYVVPKATMSVFPGPPWRPWEYGHGRLPAEIKFPIIYH